jgi:hypothetical protein
MSQLQRKFLADSIITNAKVDASAAIAYSKLAALTASRALVSDGSGFVAVSAVTATELGYVSGVTSSIQTQLGARELSANKGAANGYCPLDANSKIPSSYLTVEAVEYKGTYNATTNSPSLVNGTGNTGDFYITTVAGTQDFGAGNITFAVTDWVFYNGTIWEKVPHASISNTDGLTEGSTNLYFTDERAQDAINSAFAAGTHTGLAITYTDASNKFDFAVKYDNSSIGIDGSNQLYVKASGITNDMLAGSIADSKLSTITTANKVSGSAVQLNAENSITNSTGLKGYKQVVETITLVAGDITNQYVTLAHTPFAGSIALDVIGGPRQLYGTDYSVTGAQLDFLGDLATAGVSALVAGDKLVVSYSWM